VSTRDIWAVNEHDVLHWNGHRWRTVAIGIRLAPSFVLLGSVIAQSDRNVWIGGAAENSQLGKTEAAAHYNGHSWHVAFLPATPTPASYELVSMVPDGHGGLWALASSGTRTGGCGITRPAAGR